MKLCVVGLGKLGAPLAAVLSNSGHHVNGVDINKEFVDAINERKAPFEEPGLQELLSQEGISLRATQDYAEALEGAEASFIIVPTPSNEEGVFSNDYVLSACEQMGQILKGKSEYHVVVITSTVMPGSSDGVIREALETASGRKIGDTLGLCYSPEFIALGSVVKDMLYPDMALVGESDSRAGDLLEKVYLSVCKNQPPIQRMNLVNAELAKLAVNTFVTTKISYANMIGEICEKIPGADARVVTNAVGCDSRIGRKYLLPGTAFGGPCFPRDNKALCMLAESYGAKTDLARATESINDFQTERLADLIDAHSVNKTVSILGLSYKPGTYVTECSPGVALAETLIDKGYQVFTYDPLASIEGDENSLPDCVEKGEIVVVMTPWKEFKEEIDAEVVKDKMVFDPWRLLDAESIEGIIYPGTYQELYAQR